MADPVYAIPVRKSSQDDYDIVGNISYHVNKNLVHPPTVRKSQERAIKSDDEHQENCTPMYVKVLAVITAVSIFTALCSLVVAIYVMLQLPLATMVLDNKLSVLANAVESNITEIMTKIENSIEEAAGA